MSREKTDQILVIEGRVEITQSDGGYRSILLSEIVEVVSLSVVEMWRLGIRLRGDMDFVWVAQWRNPVTARKNARYVAGAI